MALGAIQLGVMYTFLYQSFLLLSVPEVLLFTIFTPVYIALLDDLMFRRFTPIYLLTALLAVVGAAVIRYDGIDSGFWRFGFFVVQGANLCFALGQVGYRRLSRETCWLTLRGITFLDGFSLAPWSLHYRLIYCSAIVRRYPAHRCSGECLPGLVWPPLVWGILLGTKVLSASMPVLWRS